MRSLKPMGTEQNQPASNESNRDMAQDQGGGWQVGHIRKRDADASAHIAQPVTLFFMALQAGLLGHQRGHIAIEHPVPHLKELPDFVFALLELCQCRAFPGLWPVLGPDGMQTGDMEMHAIGFIGDVGELPGHEGRVHRREGQAIRDANVATLDL